MGWWTMGRKGGIAALTGGPKDPDKDLVTGDGPADIVDGFLAEFPGRIDEAQFRAVIVRGEEPEDLALDVLQAGKTARLEIFQEYKDAWKREPYPEELEGVIDFCWQVQI